MNEPALGKAMTALAYLSQDEEARRLYEMRQKALHDEASRLEGARLEGKLEVAINMLAKGMEIATISELTGVARNELEKLKRAH